MPVPHVTTSCGTFQTLTSISIELQVELQLEVELEVVLLQVVSKAAPRPGVSRFCRPRPAEAGNPGRDVEVPAGV